MRIFKKRNLPDVIPLLIMCVVVLGFSGCLPSKQNCCIGEIIPDGYMCAPNQGAYADCKSDQCAHYVNCDKLVATNAN